MLARNPSSKVRLPVHADSRIESADLSSPVSTGRHDEFFQASRAPQQLRKVGVLDLKPIVDSEGVSFLLDAGSGDQGKRG